MPGLAGVKRRAMKPPTTGKCSGSLSTSSLRLLMACPTTVREVSRAISVTACEVDMPSVCTTSSRPGRLGVVFSTCTTALAW